LRRPPKTFFQGAPDLAVEILSPSSTPKDINERLRDFFDSGTRLAWVIHPDREFVEICHSLTDRKILGPGGHLDGLQVLPGFQYAVADLFKEWDWD
jgi:Uma2 family endonuclease